MKTLLLLLFSAFTFQSFAQDPRIFQTWELESFEWDLEPPFFISEIEPSISPTFTLEENLSFSGFGACNSFSGLMVYDDFQDTFTPVNFEATTEICEFPEHIDFENYYFLLFSPDYTYEYWIYTNPNTNEDYFHFAYSAGYAMNFRSSSLSVSENALSEFKIHPNPTTDILNITSKNPIEKLAVYSVSGRKVLEQNTIENSLDVSSLQNGVYFLEIVSPKGKSVQKFVKI